MRLVKYVNTFNQHLDSLNLVAGGPERHILVEEENLPLDLYDKQLLLQPKIARDAPGDYTYELLYYPE